MSTKTSSMVICSTATIATTKWNYETIGYEYYLKGSNTLVFVLLLVFKAIKGLFEPNAHFTGMAEVIISYLSSAINYCK